MSAPEFLVRTVTVDGEVYHLRELSAGAVEAIRGLSSEAAQDLAVVALSLAEEANPGQFTPQFAPSDIERALAYVRPLPVRVTNAIARAARQLNGLDAEDASGN